MNHNSLTTFKTTVSCLLELELDAWKNGERRWTVSNQFDKDILQDALENIEDKIEEAYESFNGTNYSIMTVAHYLTELEIEPLDSAWID